MVFGKHHITCKGLLIFHFLILWLSVKVNQHETGDSAKYLCMIVEGALNTKTPLPYYAFRQFLTAHVLCLPEAPLLLIPLPLALISA